MDRFWDLLERSVIFSGLIAMAVVGAIVYLSVRCLPIPDLLSNTGMVIIGFFFGAKVGSAGPEFPKYR